MHWSNLLQPGVLLADSHGTFITFPLCRTVNYDNNLRNKAVYVYGAPEVAFPVLFAAEMFIYLSWSFGELHEEHTDSPWPFATEV